MTREEIMARCEELDPIWQAMKNGKKFGHVEYGNNGYIDQIDLSEDNGIVHLQSYGWFDADKVTPIEPVLRVKDPVSLMQALVDGGYNCDQDGIWRTKNIDDIEFASEMFSECGLIIENSAYNWLPEWLEEVYE